MSEKRPLLENGPASGLLHQLGLWPKGLQWVLQLQAAGEKAPLTWAGGLVTRPADAGVAPQQHEPLDDSSPVLTASRAAALREQGRSSSPCQWVCRFWPALQPPWSSLRPSSSFSLWLGIPQGKMGFDLFFLCDFKTSLQSPLL